MTEEFNAQRYLEALRQVPDERIDTGLAAIAMAGYLHKHRNLQRYVNHLNAMADEVVIRHKALISRGAKDDAGSQSAALKFVLSETYHYCLCPENAEIYDAADIVRVTDTRSGCAGVICLLYQRTGAVLGWDVEVLRFPSYYLCRIEAGGQRIIYDPSRGCKVSAAHDLRALVKEKAGEKAELSSEYLQPVSRRDLLIQVFNQIKTRQIECGDYAGALETIGVMRLVAPEEIRLWLDCGVLRVKTGDFDAAAADLEAFIQKSPYDRDRAEAVLLLDEIRGL